MDMPARSGTSSKAQAVTATAVDIKEYAFTPETIKVKVGETVTWTNQDSVQHNVAADTPSADAPDGPLIGKGETYKFTFNKAGTYTYHCTPHPSMKGTVIVSE
jgi:amicyanin